MHKLPIVVDYNYFKIDVTANKKKNAKKNFNWTYIYTSNLLVNTNKAGIRTQIRYAHNPQTSPIKKHHIIIFIFIYLYHLYHFFI